MEKKLYVIYQEYTREGYATEIAEVNVIYETEKQIRICQKGIYRNTINKADLDCIVSNGQYLFTYDLTEGTRVWNNYYQTKADVHKYKMEEALASLI